LSDQALSQLTGLNLGNDTRVYGSLLPSENQASQLNSDGETGTCGNGALESNKVDATVTINTRLSPPDVSESASGSGSLKVVSEPKLGKGASVVTGTASMSDTTGATKSIDECWFDLPVVGGGVLHVQLAALQGTQSFKSLCSDTLTYVMAYATQQAPGSSSDSSGTSAEVQSIVTGAASACPSVSVSAKSLGSIYSSNLSYLQGDLSSGDCAAFQHDYTAMLDGTWAG